MPCQAGTRCAQWDEAVGSTPLTQHNQAAGPLLTGQLIRVLALLCELFPDKEVLAINVTKLLPAVRTWLCALVVVAHVYLHMQTVGEAAPLVQACWLDWQRSVLLPAGNNLGARRQCALFLQSPVALLDMLQLAATAGAPVARAARSTVADVLEASGLFEGTALELQLWLAVLCVPSMRYV